jgi:predicted DNA-binding protein YlxM (UPF0122 family)
MVNYSERHHGHVLEKVIRRNGHSISNIARMANVNRRSVYNWFTQPRLKFEVIKNIGQVINYDFSLDFPDLFAPVVLKRPGTARQPEVSNVDLKEQQALTVWKNKYLDLLERYNELLTKKMVERK